jgi:hypothetical protein
MRTVATSVAIALLFVAVFSGSASAAPVTFTTEAGFQAAATGITLTLEGFEGLALLSPSPLDMGPFSLLSADGTIDANTLAGLYSEGVQSWGVGGVFGNLPGYPVSIVFDSPVNAIGFDILGELTVATQLTIAINGGAPILILNSEVPFIGIVDLVGSISSVEIVQNNGDDGMGIDRLQFGAASQEIPEPSSLTLLCLGLVGLGAYRRRRGASEQAA